MRYRALDANLDYSFGQGSQNFLIDSPAAVAQLCYTRLELFLGEWFLDTTQGVPWATDVIGAGTAATRDLALRQCILETIGVTGLVSYASQLNTTTRAFTVEATIDTVYGRTNFTVTA